nr:hypothetical protein BaRGS_011327 [Batillaria attramentaria]
MRLRLKLDSNFGASNGEMAVVTNGDCGEPESVAITVDSNYIYFKVDSEGASDTQQLSVPYNPNGGWLQISLQYEKQPGPSDTYLLTGTVDGQSDSLTFSGKIDMRMCALQIGQGFNYARLVGYVDDI